MGGQSLLHRACATRETICVKLLLTVPGVSVGVNAKDSNGSTPLHLAVTSENIDIVKMLLATPGVDVNIKDNHGYTPLRCTGYNNTAIAQLLRQHGATQ